MDGERSRWRRRCLARRAGVDTPVVLRSGSTRSWSEGGVASRLRLGAPDEDVERGSLVLALGSVSHGRVRGIPVVLLCVVPCPSGSGTSGGSGIGELQLDALYTGASPADDVGLQLGSQHFA